MSRVRIAAYHAPMHQPPASAASPSSGPQTPFRMRSLMISAFLPTLLFGMGQGAAILATPLFAKDLGATTAMIGLIVAMRGLGTMVFDIPAGMLVSRFGEKWTLVGGTLLLAVVAIGSAWCQAPWQFSLLSFAMGNSWAVFLLARLSYVSESTPNDQRGRALSILGGVNRVGNFIGPVVGGYVMLWFGTDSAFYIQALLSAAAALLMFFVVDDASSMPAAHGVSAFQRFAGVLRENRRIFATAGVATVMIHVLRTARQIVLPLASDAMGLDPAMIGIVYGISSFIDMAMFYPAGWITDRFGRKWIGVPSLLILSVGLALMPFATGFWTLCVIGFIQGMGNGLGSGIVMTLGADFSPSVGRGEFLGVWRLMADMGASAGPMMFGLVAAAATLGVASVATAGLGFLGAAIMAFTVPETLHRRQRGP